MKNCRFINGLVLHFRKKNTNYQTDVSHIFIKFCRLKLIVSFRPILYMGTTLWYMLEFYIRAIDNEKEWIRADKPWGATRGLSPYNPWGRVNYGSCHYDHLNNIHCFTFLHKISLWKRRPQSYCYLEVVYACGENSLIMHHQKANFVGLFQLWICQYDRFIFV